MTAPRNAPQRKDSEMSLELVEVGAQVPMERIALEGSVQKVRRETTDQNMKELIDSIQRHGQIHPVSLMEREDSKFEVINGNRRTLAHRLGKMPTIRANIYRVPEGQEENRELLIQQHLYAANMAEPLLPIERARMFEAVMDEFGFSVEQVAESFEGETAQTVADALDFLAIDETVLDIVTANPGRFTEAHLRVLAEYASGAKKSWRMKPDEQVRIARELVDQTDKQVAADPRKFETRIKAVVKERRDRESERKAEIKRGQSDPIKSLFRAIEAVETQTKALIGLELDSIKSIDSADKGQAMKKVFDIIDALTVYNDDRLSKLPVRKAVAAA
jgi:ParB/RepB/Spo0J family partition protein